MGNEHSIINKGINNIMPWLFTSHNSNAEYYFEENAKEYLNQFYIFTISQISVPSIVDDISKYINERYRSMISAAYGAGLTLITSINGEKGETSVHIGILYDKSKPIFEFQKIIEGVFPGVKIDANNDLMYEDFIGDKEYGGIVSSIPSLKIEDEKQEFNISSIIRSMYGEDYTLLIISRPVAQEEMIKNYHNLMRYKDEFHSLARRTIGKEKGEGKSDQIQNSETITRGSSKGINVGFGAFNMVSTSIGLALGPLAFGIASAVGHSINAGVNYSRNKSKGKTSGTVKGTETHISESLSFEEQNGLAIELEKMSDKFIDRIKQGLNTGFWETSISFLSSNEEGRNILSRSFSGELSKPNKDGMPPIVYLPSTDIKKGLLIPKEDYISDIFPKSLCSYITSEELAFISAFPKENIPGYEIVKTPQLSLTDLPGDSEKNTVQLGSISDLGKVLENSKFKLSNADLAKHTFISGITGSGKTTTVKQILKQSNVPFLVLESAKKEYRQLLNDEKFKNNLRIYTIGNVDISPLRINPFYIMKGVSPLSHIDNLKAIFNASFSLYGPMPHILEKCLHNIYKKKGWNLTRGTHRFMFKDGEYDDSVYSSHEHLYCFPTLEDLKTEVDCYLNNNLYKGETNDNIRAAIITRLESLCVGAKGYMFNTFETVDFKELLMYPTIFEMEGLADDDDKAFFLGMILTFLGEYRQQDNPDTNPFIVDYKGLKHLLVVEEAHRLLKNVETERTQEMLGNPKGKAVETFCNIIAEMRSLGQGVIVAEQIPSKIANDVIKNTNNKITHRLVGKDDQLLLSGSLSMSEEDSKYLSRLTTGYALCHKEGMAKPAEIKVETDIKKISISDNRVHNLMKSINAFISDDELELNELNQYLGSKSMDIIIKFFNSLLLIKEEGLCELLSDTIRQLNYITMKNSYLDRFSNEIFKKHIINEVAKMFIGTNGIYSRNKRYPDNFEELLNQLIMSNKVECLQSLKNNIETYWEKPINKWLSHIISQLTIKHFISKDIKVPTNKLITEISKRYFSVPVDEISSLICEEVQRTMGVY